MFKSEENKEKELIEEIYKLIKAHVEQEQEENKEKELIEKIYELVKEFREGTYSIPYNIRTLLNFLETSQGKELTAFFSYMYAAALLRFEKNEKYSPELYNFFKNQADKIFRKI